MEILSRMDEKILALVDEGQVEAEMEQADFVIEKAELAIINIDEALTNLPKSSDSKKRSPSNRESSCSPLSCSSEVNPTVNGLKDNVSPSPPGTVEKSLVTLLLYESHHTTTATPFSPISWTFTFPSVPSFEELRPVVTSLAPSDHLLPANKGSSPCTLTQVHSKPVSSMCTTCITSVCGSGIMTSSLNSRTSQPSRPSLACGTDYSFQTMPDGRASSVPVMLPTIPEMTVPKGPPPLLPHDVVGLTPHIDSCVASPHRAAANAAVPIQVTTQDVPVHVGLSPGTYILHLLWKQEPE